MPFLPIFIYSLIIEFFRINNSKINIYLFKTKHKQVSLLNWSFLILFNFLNLDSFKEPIFIFTLNVFLILSALIEHFVFFKKGKLIKENKYDTKIPIDYYQFIPLVIILIVVSIFLFPVYFLK